jgi:T4-like virus Myoviridae tail sheath stabiliser
MLGHDVFYFNLVRKYIALFGTLFNEIYITRTNSADAVVKTIKVPIVYSPKDKMISRMDADPDIGRQTAIVSPRLAYEMTGMYYDGTRHLPATIKNVVRNPSSNNALLRQYTPVAYNLDFNLYIYSKNAEDATKILEQILPFFTPAHTPTVELVAEMNEVKDIPIILHGVTPEDNYADAIEQRRAVIYTLSFTMKGYLYGPVVSTGIIKFANTTFYIANTENVRDSVGEVAGVERVTLRPGLTANGQPTSNISLTIPLADIDEDDNYGIITTTTTLI